jgi:hypothetical protein
MASFTEEVREGASFPPRRCVASSVQPAQAGWHLRTLATATGLMFLWFFGRYLAQGVLNLLRCVLNAVAIGQPCLALR